MNQPGNALASTARWAILGALALGAFGCELISTIDRSLIDGTTSTGTGGAGGNGGGGGSSTSTGGGGGMPECVVAADCPATANECVTRTCVEGKCGTALVAAGTAVAAQTAGDCQVKQCDGAGMVTDADDNADVPTDALPCTNDVCTAGVPSHPNAAAGTACGNNLTCDGNGACTGCAAGTDCPGTDDECQMRTCTASVCGMSFTAPGTPSATQLSGDCKTSQCDGSGALIAVPNDADLPVDNNQCTGDVCTGGAPSNPATAAGGVCAQMGGIVCNGTGACVECNSASTCPGVDSECQSRTCTAGMCGIAFQGAGTPAATQTAGDCKVNQCNGAGLSVPANDDTDLPDDSNPCTSDTCALGVAVHTPVPVNTSCGGTQVCDATGVCTGCVTAATCPGTDTECQTRTCNVGTCGFSFTSANTATSMQTAGDCKKNTCDGAGGIVPATDDTDVPVDGNQCTSDVCTAGSPSNPPAASGLVCSQMSGTVCSGGGVCVECLSASACPGTDTDCKVRTCSAAGACGFANTAAGTVTSTQSTGDCQENQCDGAGSSAPVNKDTDLPVDSNQCTSDVCTAGTPSNPPTASGSACNQNGGLFCSGTGSCVECVSGASCASGVCTNNVCQSPSCTDSVKNGTETGLDCGGGTCPSCALTLGCMVASDCTSGICTGNVCSQVNGCDFNNALDVTGGAPTTVTFANGNFTYAPKCIKVTQGTVVNFNGNFASHPLLGGEVVGGAKVPASSGPFVPITNTGTTAAFTMSSTGAFPYYCDAHALLGMTGAVFVVP